MFRLTINSSPSSHQRPAEDTDDEAEQRRLWAEEASVDANRILTQGRGSLLKVCFGEYG